MAADGRLGAATTSSAHGQERAPERQTAASAAWPWIPGNRFAFVCDLGLDKVDGLPVGRGKGKLAPHHPRHAAQARGRARGTWSSGPTGGSPTW